MVKGSRNVLWARYPISRNARWRVRKLQREAGPSRLNLKKIFSAASGKIKYKKVTLSHLVLWLLEHRQDIPRPMWWRTFQRVCCNP